MIKQISRITVLSALLILMAISSAQAKDYLVEVIVFENLNSAHQTQYFEYKYLDELADPDKLWSVKPSLLLSSLESINNSPDYRLLHHFSWAQQSLPLSQAPSYNVTESNLTGRIKVYAKQLLFANLNLNFNGYQINEKRRIKLNEKHFYDHPKFGILMQVSRLEATQD